MPDPTVRAVMITANRPEMARRALNYFERQTYERKGISVFSSDPESCGLPEIANRITRATIGEMRNEANRRIRDTEFRGKPVAAHFIPEILCHWDDDDYSAPRRIEEQVALLQASGAQAVGYNQMLFWREHTAGCPAIADDESDEVLYDCGECACDSGAWLYTGSILGTSLCYWRASWERKHFEAMSNGEDTRWLMGMKAVGASSLIVPDGIPFTDPMKPRMIARIHSGNTSNAYNPQVMRAVEKQGGEWKRVSEFDDYCRKVFA